MILFAQLQATHDERTGSFGIVVTHFFANVIFKASVTLIVWLLYVWTIARTETTYAAALGQTDGLVRVHLAPVGKQLS